MSDQATIERIYILNGGIAHVEAASIYSPGFRVGEPSGTDAAPFDRFRPRLCGNSPKVRP